ncbi:DUF5916 domain-containing protein [Bacteroidota bacterium]
MKKRSAFLILFLLAATLCFAQNSKKETSATRITVKPNIDGILDDETWQNLPILIDFLKFNPYNGKNAEQKTEIKICYDDEAIYVGAVMYDTAPDSMMTELGERDSKHHINTELISVQLSPFNDGNNSFHFYVSITGVQSDEKCTIEHPDLTWDAVWESDVSITDYGWIAEIKIPFSALRFSTESIQDWGLNFYRRIPRHAEWDNWSFASMEFGSWWEHMGLLKDMKDINPPLRLSFTPYVSGYIEKNTENKWGYTFNGGMDLKYGINESFTLDATLIPDFGQVQSDDIVLNLSPQETWYNEKRQFFTEGTELFNKGGIFYSRRIGSTPAGYSRVGGQLNANETIIENPAETSLINSTKVSGRTDSGLGIGVINSMTSNTYATVRDTITGIEREIMTQGFTNYNIFVLDQMFENNSYLSLTNTNVMREGFIANVTATDFQFKDMTNTWRVNGIGAISQRHTGGKGDFGYKLQLNAGKVGGQFRYNYFFQLETDKFDPNDLGYLYQNNEIVNDISLEYNIYQPFGIFLDWYNHLDINYQRIYNPSKFTDFYISYSFAATFKNQYTMEMHAMLRPVGRDNYFEARTPGRVFKMPKEFHNCFHLTSDTRKPFYFSVGGGMNKPYSSNYDQLTFSYYFDPTYRINDQLILSIVWGAANHKNELGYVNIDGQTGIIHFGKRQRDYYSIIFNTSYIISNDASLNLRLRHYWSTVEYDTYFDLMENGDLAPSIYNENHNINYNAFNIDMTFKWNFAPGSELLLVWKNAIYDQNDNINVGYWDNLQDTWGAPQINSLSLKVLYYIDYLSL